MFAIVPERAWAMRRCFRGSFGACSEAPPIFNNDQAAQAAIMKARVGRDAGTEYPMKDEAMNWQIEFFTGL